MFEHGNVGKKQHRKFKSRKLNINICLIQCKTLLLTQKACKRIELTTYSTTLIKKD